MRSEVRLGANSLPLASDYLALLKPRVMSLVVFTGFAGVVLAPGELHPLLSLVAVFLLRLLQGEQALLICGTTAISMP